MPRKSSTTSSDDLRAIYAATTNYHVGLVQVRFSVVGLFLAANGFLAIGFFQPGESTVGRIALPVIAFLITFIFYMLEVRNFHIIENLDRLGRDLEKRMGVAEEMGFFSLMSNMKVGALLIPTLIRLRVQKNVYTIFSHSFWISMIYILIGLFWALMLFLGS